jgi:hypothetical protein
MALILKFGLCRYDNNDNPITQSRDQKAEQKRHRFKIRAELAEEVETLQGCHMCHH